MMSKVGAKGPKYGSLSWVDAFLGFLYFMKYLWDLDNHGISEDKGRPRTLGINGCALCVTRPSWCPNSPPQPLGGGEGVGVGRFSLAGCKASM